MNDDDDDDNDNRNNAIERENLHQVNESNATEYMESIPFIILLDRYLQIH